ncbi:MAG: hypothetical protein EBQ85_02390 [Proteobacteria bacterium]|nr:hypothetical protein [Pseudomonadota bacterium]
MFSSHATQKSLFFVSVLFWGIAGSSPLPGEIPHTSTAETEAAGNKKRPSSSEQLSSDELEFLQSGFFRVEESLRERYENSKDHKNLFLPAGITAALTAPGDESVIAAVLAELAGSLNMKQIEVLMNKGRTLASQIREQTPKDRDARLLTLAERSEWLAMILRGETPGAESLPLAKDEKAFERFKQEFLTAQKSVNNKNKDILSKIDEAKNGNKDAKKWLRDNLDMKSFTTFLSGQRESGGEKLFEDSAEALVWKDDQGNKYHDFTDPNGRFRRVYVASSPQEHAKAFGDYLQKNKAKLNNWALSPRRLEAGTPEIVNLTSKQAPKPTPSASGATPHPAGPTASSAPTPTPQGNLNQVATAIFRTNCVDCHVKDGTPITDFQMAADLVRSGSMPRNKRLSAGEKSALIEFLTGPSSKEALIQMQQ